MTDVLTHILVATNPTYSSAPHFDANWHFDSLTAPIGAQPHAHGSWSIDDRGLVISERGADAWRFRMKEINFEEPNLFSDGAFFACTSESIPRPFLPSFSFINQQGQVDMELVSNPLLFVLMVHYTRAWPQDLKFLIGQSQEPVHGWFMIDLICRRPELLDVARLTPSYFFEATRLGLTHIAKLDVPAFADALLHIKRPILVGNLVGQKLGRRHIRALEKLSLDVDFEGRDRFWLIAQHERKFDAFLHAKEISTELLETVAGLSAWMLSINPKLACYFEVEMAHQLRAICLANAMSSNFENLERDISLVRSRQGLWGVIKRYMHPRDFPEPPIAPHGTLKAITNMKSLRKASLRFRNCAEGYARDIASGRAYLYVLEQKDPIMISIARSGDIWRLESARRIRNRDVDPKTYDSIKAMIEDGQEKVRAHRELDG